MKNLTNCEMNIEDILSEIDGRKGYVYLIKGGNWVKVGVSKDPVKRLKNLDQTLLPFEPKIVAILEARNYKDIEKQLHEEYEHKRIRGEWFILDKDNIEDIVKGYGFNLISEYSYTDEEQHSIKEFVTRMESAESEKLKNLKKINKEIEKAQASIIHLLASTFRLRLKGLDVTSVLSIIPEEYYSEFFTVDTVKLQKLIDAYVDKLEDND